MWWKAEFVAPLVLFMAWQAHAFVNGTNFSSNCTDEGHFVNPYSTNCETYIKCQNLNGSLVGSIYTCPIETIFDPLFGYCVYNRTCNGTNITFPGNNETNSTSPCTQEGIFADPNSTNCNTYLKCLNLNGTLVASIHACPNNTIFDPAYGTCVFSNNSYCNGSNITFPGNNETNSTSPCTQEGIFADPNSTNCNTYLKCLNVNGTLVASIHACPNNTFFDPAYGTCVFSNNSYCNGSNITFPGNNETNSTSPCTQEGIFADPNSTNCNTYLKCLNVNGTLVASIHACPNNTIFDSAYGTCVFSNNSYCNGSNITFPGNNETNSTSPCTQEGIFADPNSTNCNTYLKCLNLNGTLVVSIHACPNNTVFDPAYGTCVFSNNSYCNGSNITFPGNNETNSTSPCTQEGIFADPNSTNCNTYLKCLNVNGTLVASIHACPNNTFFDPAYGTCVFSNNSYCNGSNITFPGNNETNSTSPCTQEGIFADPNSTNCNTYLKCLNLNGTLVVSIHACPNNTVFDPAYGTCVFSNNSYCNGSNITFPGNNETNSTSPCTQEGIFADPNSTNCNTYLKCLNVNGTLVASIHACPNNTFFDPAYGTCVFSNNSYCNGSNITFPGNNETNSTSPCTQEGIFADPNSTNCNTYLKCLNVNGTLVASIHACPNNTIFDSAYGTCVFSNNSYCNGSNITFPGNNETNSTSPCTQEGIFADPNSTNCNTYLKCLNLNGTLVVSIHACPNNTVFDPAYGTCVFSNNSYCNGSNITFPGNNETNSTSPCTQEGIFADPNSTNCNTYLKCLNVNGTLVASIHACPNNTFFDPAYGTCVFSNNSYCNGSNITFPGNNETNSTSPCTQEGIFADPNSTNCNTYLKCLNVNGTLVASIHACPNNTIFDSAYGTCVFSNNSYCNGSNITFPGNNETNSTSPCTQEGIFADPNSTNCNTYLKCLNLNGTLVVSIHACPNNTVFDPAYGTCVFSNNSYCNGSNITFPGNNETNSTSPCTQEGIFADPNSTNCNTYLKCLNLNGTLVGSIHTCPNNTIFDSAYGTCVFSNNSYCNGSNIAFPGNNETNSTSPCTQEGIFVDPNSTNCKTYLKCLNVNGTLVDSIHACPNNTIFDPAYGTCVFSNNGYCNGSKSSFTGNKETNPLYLKKNAFRAFSTT